MVVLLTSEIYCDSPMIAQKRPITPGSVPRVQGKGTHFKLLSTRPSPVLVDYLMAVLGNVLRTP